jgi:hypothetical protein
MTLTADIQPLNSLSYADVAGINLGLERLPGETNHAFVERLYRAAASVRNATYQGLLNEICLQLGLGSGPGIRFESTDPLALVAVRGTRTA